MGRCGDCRNWVPVRPSEARRLPRFAGFGYCQASAGPTSPLLVASESGACLYTRHDFGCVLHEPAPRPEASR